MTEEIARIDELCNRVMKWRVKQGFHTPGSIEGEDKGDMLAKLSLFMEETGEAKTAVRKADFENFVEEITDTLIRVMDVSSAVGHRLLSSGSMICYREAIPPEAWGKAAFYQAIEDWEEALPPRDLKEEESRRKMLLAIMVLNDCILNGAYLAVQTDDMNALKASLDYLTQFLIGLLWRVGEDFHETVNKKMLVNEKRPPRNGKVSNI